MTVIIRDEEFTVEGKNVRPDPKRRVVLPKGLVQEGVTYRVWVNASRQIVLDPQVTIPASEAWLFADKAALAALDRGMAESASGQTVDLGSFAEYAKDAP